MKVTSTSVLTLKAMETVCRFSQNKVRSPKHFYFPFLLPRQHGREVMSCCHCMTTLPKQPLEPTWVFLNSIITPRRKPTLVSPQNPTHPHHAVTAKTWNLMAKRTVTRSRQQVIYSSLEKVWRKLCPLKADTADLLQHLWFDPL